MILQERALKMVLKTGDRTCGGRKDRNKMQEGLRKGTCGMVAWGRIFYSGQPCADAGLAALHLDNFKDCLKCPMKM